MRVRVIPLCQRERGKNREVRALLHVEKRPDEKWLINECSMRWLCSPEGLGSLADEELTLSGKSQLGTGLCLSFVRFSPFIPLPNPQYFSFWYLYPHFFFYYCSLSIFLLLPSLIH